MHDTRMICMAKYTFLIPTNYRYTDIGLERMSCSSNPIRHNIRSLIICRAADIVHVRTSFAASTRVYDIHRLINAPS